MKQRQAKLSEPKSNLLLEWVLSFHDRSKHNIQIRNGAQQKKSPPLPPMQNFRPLGHLRPQTYVYDPDRVHPVHDGILPHLPQQFFYVQKPLPHLLRSTVSSDVIHETNSQSSFSSRCIPCDMQNGLQGVIHLRTRAFCMIFCMEKLRNAYVILPCMSICCEHCHVWCVLLRGASLAFPAQRRSFRVPVQRLDKIFLGECQQPSRLYMELT